MTIHGKCQILTIVSLLLRLRLFVFVVVIALMFDFNRRQWWTKRFAGCPHEDGRNRGQGMFLLHRFVSVLLCLFVAQLSFVLWVPRSIFWELFIAPR